MNQITLENLLNNLKDYSKEEINLIMKAYECAKDLHKGQFRESGEPYIIHPLNVAYILSEGREDAETISAGFLHDTLEDTNISKEDIIKEFGLDVANLVDGVTKISKLNFNSKNDQNMANIRKLITSLCFDFRTIKIKLADRLHNMRTLDFKKPNKQIDNSLETMEIHAPLAYYIGAYKIKGELEDLSLKYLYPDDYKRVVEMKNKIEEESSSCLKEMLETINSILLDNNIPHEIKTRTKNIYGIYKGLSEGKKLLEIHDLLALKVMVDSIPLCYQSLGLVHEKYHPVNEMFKDYICNPKTNMYRSLHTTVFGPEDRLVQTQIRTHDMEKIALYGLPTRGNSREKMQEEFKRKYQFVNSLEEIDSVFTDNKDFVEHIQSELFADKIYVYTTKGDVIELPKGSTAIDFAYQIHTDLGNTMVSALVNDEPVNPEYVLHDKDRVHIITDKNIGGPKEEWFDKVQTTRAKRKIKEFGRKI